MRNCIPVILAATLAAAFGGAVEAAPAKYDVAVPSTPQTVIRGVISAKRAPIARVRSGQTVRVDTISHGGLVDDPVAFFAKAGIPASQVLKDVIDVAKMPRQAGFGGHVLTGPIFIEGAEPGDMLEVRIVDVESRVPYGVNNPGPGGVAPTLVSERNDKIIKFDVAKGVAYIAPGVTAPTAPFQGIMAVAPRPEVAEVGSREPGEFGGSYYRLMPEGTLKNWDGLQIKVNKDREGLDLNRNFPSQWRQEYEQVGAGPYPTSEPEVRAMVDFITKLNASPQWRQELETRKWTNAFMTERPFERDLAKDIAEKEVLMKELGLA